MGQMDCTPQILGPALSSAFINDLGDDTERPHGKGAEGAGLGSLGGSHSDGEVAQQKPQKVSQKEIYSQKI